MSADRVIVFGNSALVPAEWRFRAGPGPIWAFNPAILADGGSGWIFVYRLVFRDELRRIAICRLDAEFRVIPDSCVPVSDLIRPERSAEYSEADRTWFADPRLYRLGGKLLLYWNSGWHDSPNAQFLQELDEDTMHPRGTPRSLQRDGLRRTIEKNWTFFGEKALFAVYSITGQRILQADSDGLESIRFHEVFGTEWDAGPYVREFGALRGGAPPHLVDDSYYSFCHSVCRSATGYRYVPAVYRFAAEPPFAPTHAPSRPVPLENPFGTAPFYQRLNPAVAEVLYPSGAVFDRGNWVISYGVNDERCAVAVISDSSIQACLRAAAVP